MAAHSFTHGERIMLEAFRNASRIVGLAICFGALLFAHLAVAQTPQSVQSFRTSYAALMDSYDQIFTQEGNVKGQQMVERARTAIQSVSDAALVRAFSRSGMPDLKFALAATQRIAASSQSQRSAPSATVKSLPLPGAGTVIDDCNNTPHGDQITYDALIAFQVTSGILAAAAWVCNEDILGENGSAACIPLAIANDIASSLFAVRSFCGGLDTASLVFGNFDRLDHVHSDLAAVRTDIINNASANTTALTNSINASMTSIINNANANTTAVINNANANTTSIMNNDNTNRDIIIGQLQALGCEIVRLLNTPDGLRASSIAACKAQPGFPYSWNKH